MRRWALRFLLLLLLVIVPALVDCSAPSGGEAQDKARAANTPAAAPKKASSARVVLSAPGHDAVTVRVEIMATAAEREHGLMFRRQLDPDAGMLFLFERPQALTFWMHNTYLPLDMIFIAPDMTILGIVENATPLTDDARKVPGLSRYVLEVNAGFSRKNGLVAGNVVRFIDVPVESAK